MRSKLVYSCSIKICASGFSELLESIFCLLLVLEAFSLQKSCRDVWRSGSWLARGQVNMAHEAKLHGPIHSTFEALVVRHVVRYCGELGPFCWPVLASASVHPLNLLGVLLTCNGFTRIQKAIVDQMSSRPPNSDQDFFFFFLVHVWLWEVLWSFFSVRTSHWAGHCRLLYKIHFSSHVTIWSRNG